MDAGTVETIVSQANGLAGLIVLFGSLRGGLTVSKSRAIGELAGARNQAAHVGRRPTNAETSTAVQCAHGIVSSATPLAFP